MYMHNIPRFPPHQHHSNAGSCVSRYALGVRGTYPYVAEDCSSVRSLELCVTAGISGTHENRGLQMFVDAGSNPEGILGRMIVTQVRHSSQDEF